MQNTINEVLKFINENDVKFIRLSFCDILGSEKNISIMPHELENAFIKGVSFDANSIKGFRDITKSDLFLFPDPSTLTLLPWRLGSNRVVKFICDIKYPNGDFFEDDSRYILKKVTEKCKEIGYTTKIGAECEFYLFKTDADLNPTKVPLDNGEYLDVYPLDKGEDIRREICLSLEDMGIMPESSHHEQGPGQNEIDFAFSDALSCADNLLVFKSIVKNIATQNGLFASFMPKPLLNNAGNGLHINMSLSKDKENIFKLNDNDLPIIAQQFIAGILYKAEEISLFLNPVINSYDRLGGFEAPKYISWSKENRSQFIRIPAAASENSRIEVRSADPSVNPYLAFSLLTMAGFYGIENNLKLPKSDDINLYNADKEIVNKLKTLPTDLKSAINLAENSDFIKEVLGESLLNKYINIKKDELIEYTNSKDKLEFINNRYFIKL